MGNIFDKLNKALDAFTDALLEEVSDVKSVEVYRYEDIVLNFRKKIEENSRIVKCRIAVEKVNEYDNRVFSEARYLIRLLFLDIDDNPIKIGVENFEEAYEGTVVIASAIDSKLKEYMGDKTQKTLVVRGIK